ncbi:DUF4245 domain-containing protein [Corynebacterium uterequi]|uniref:DUF4245 domain-containing protein n=1 Tax=Corynebacterium uterequi TaxID=1072256 RepID=UPI0009E529C3|nr:DUF4245 domain-containing protein [Corynebacterium uterequi]
MAQDKKPRIFTGGRDMAISMVIIVVLMVAVVLPTGLCSFEPGAPEGGPVVKVDEETFLAMEAQALSYPVVIPAVPEGWTANSARRSAVGQTPAPVVGYLTDDGGYLQLTQTSVPLDEAVSAYDGELRSPAGTVDVAGTTVTHYTSDYRGVRDLWAFETKGATNLISGVATEDAVRQLVDATLNGTPAA